MLANVAGGNKPVVSFSYPPDFKIAMPTAVQLVRLLQIARVTLHPNAPELSDTDEREFLASFAASFEFVSTLKRTDDSFNERAEDWVMRAERWHQERGAPATISLSPLMVAVVASGDICWQAPPDRWPHDVFAGVTFDSSARAPASAWRDVLQSGRVRPMTPVKVSRHPVPHPLVYHPGGG